MILYTIKLTPYNDYDILAFGSLKELKALVKRHKGSHLITNSKKYNTNLVIIDTFDTIKDAIKVLIELEG